MLAGEKVSGKKTSEKTEPELGALAFAVSCASQNVSTTGPQADAVSGNVSTVTLNSFLAGWPSNQGVKGMKLGQVTTGSGQ